jgi:hypothetical protein
MRAGGSTPGTRPNHGMPSRGMRYFFLIEGAFRETRFCCTFGADRSFYQDLGLKPMAESYHPFGIKTDKRSRNLSSCPGIENVHGACPASAIEGARPRFFLQNGSTFGRILSQLSCFSLGQ